MKSNSLSNIDITNILRAQVIEINGIFMKDELPKKLKKGFYVVNLASNSVFMRGYNYNDVQNNPDVNELTNFNRRGITIVFPNTGTNPANPSGMLCREYGCQMVAMRYQYIDNFLEENALFFDRATYAFCLKPERLRYVPVTVPNPTPQNPAYSYATRKVSTDYYSFNF